MNFRASSGLSQAAGFAVADLSDEGGGGGGGNDNDERLEIAKLGVDEQIVSALARKGITKLFPIQVYKRKDATFSVFRILFEE